MLSFIFCYVECRVLVIIMLNAIMLNIIMLSLAMLSVVTPFFVVVDGQNQTLDLQLGQSCWLLFRPLVGNINFKWLKKNKEKNV